MDNVLQIDRTMLTGNTHTLAFGSDQFIHRSLWVSDNHPGFTLSWELARDADNAVRGSKEELEQFRQRYFTMPDLQWPDIVAV